ncbi:unnamed protein product [Polarella glacialis]|uniref:Crossover junction endonuclease MUS81 n=1 Tax=Polarella glacialis TaxID=89957 RepID=A0A813IBN9_POLGL|nr:unnamed protein product [Polarella glacialis]CAE8647666.1 unnamed protein product [Polarella glacialis]
MRSQADDVNEEEEMNRAIKLSLAGQHINGNLHDSTPVPGTHTDRNHIDHIASAVSDANEHRCPMTSERLLELSSRQPQPSGSQTNNVACFRKSLGSACTMDLDSSDEELPKNSEAQPQQQQLQPVHKQEKRDPPIVLVIDVRERSSDKTPRNIFEAAQQQLAGAVEVDFAKLQVGDYVWVSGPERRLLGACIERKTVSDLVGRSARGDHLRQLRRLQLPGILWPAVVLEGDETLADKRAVAYGASRFSACSLLDSSIRDSQSVLRFLAQTAIFSRAFVLLSGGTQDTIALLQAWSSVLMRCGPDRDAGPSLSSLGRLAKASDEDHSSLIEAARAAGATGRDLDLICHRFESLESLKATYGQCADDQRRQMLLAELFLAGASDEEAPGDGSDWARATGVSSQLWEALGGRLVGVEPSLSRAYHPSQLRLDASPGLLADIRQHSAGDDGLEVTELRMPGAVGAVISERVRLQLIGQGSRSGWRSLPVSVDISAGQTVLGMLQQACDLHSEVAEVAAHVADNLASILELTGTCRQMIVLEGVGAAAIRAQKQGKEGTQWKAASRIKEMLPAIVAALAVRHGIVAMLRANPQRTMQFLLAVGQVLRERGLLTQ